MSTATTTNPTGTNTDPTCPDCDRYACERCAHERLVAETVKRLNDDLKTVMKGLAEAERTFTSLADGTAWYVEYSYGLIGHDITAHLADAARSVRAAAAINRDALT